MREVLPRCSSIRQILGELGLRQAGGNYLQISKSIKELKLNTKHFKGRAWNKGLRGIGKPRLSLEEILISNTDYQSYKLKKRLFAAKLKPIYCEECGWAKISEDGRVPLELDHINGDSKDNRFENLRVLCPNCHSLKPTHRGRNQRRARGEWRNWNTRDA